MRGVGDKDGVHRPASPAAGSPAAQSPIAGDAEKESYQFWLAQGYSPAQAAGLVANEQAESGFKPAAVGDNGSARGLFQWHPDRVAKILAATGIDVRTAGHMDQLKAAAWELQSRGDDTLLRSATTPEDASNIVNRKFEVSADYSMRRAALAAQIAQSQMASASASPFNAAGAAPGAPPETTASASKPATSMSTRKPPTPTGSPPPSAPASRATCGAP